MDPQEFFSSRAQRVRPRKLPALEGEVVVGKTGTGSAWRHTKTGYRPDLELVFRSGWEANIARIFTCYDIGYEFEPTVFQFPIKRGTRGYTPDFYLPKTGEWVEVKGYFDDKSRIKLKRFKKYFPASFDKLTLIIGRSKNSILIAEDLGIPYLFYPDISTHFRGKITNWEGQ